MCRVLEVSASGFYAWKKRTETPGADRYARARAILRAEFQANERVYGRRRLRFCLRQSGHFVSTKKVAQLMREENIIVRYKRKFVKTTDSKHSLPVAPNLLHRHFQPDRPNAVWVSDITYCWRAGGWSYLAAVKDLCTQRIVGWSMSKNIDVALVMRALRMAFGLQQPAPGLIFHSDRGSQYASKAVSQFVAERGARQSMSRKANCWDNAPAESFFARFKQECLSGKRFVGHETLEAEITRYIADFYNTKRLHSSLGYLSPLQYEEHLRASESAA